MHDRRTPRARTARSGRTMLGVLAVAFAAAGGLFVVLGLQPDAEVTVEVDAVQTQRPDVTDAEPTSSPAPTPAAPATETSTPVAPTTGSATEPSTAPTDVAADDPELSPLAELLGPTYSAVPDEIEPRPQPVGLAIDAFDVTGFPIRAVGLEDDGQLEVPDETEIGWYRYGATAGRDGATVLAAHVSWNGTVGPFGSLGTLDPGSQITVTLDDGTTRAYEVFERAIYGKLELPRERIWRNTGPETLVLITCGGDFNPEIRRYRENIVVYAAPID